MRAVVLLVLALVAGFALPLRAEVRPLTGQDDPAFQDALDRWLTGHEADALPALASLAAADNAAAQVLIGVIDVTPQFQGRWLYALSRAQRIALMRVPRERPGENAFDLSGRNWLREAAGDEPLAEAWLRLWDGNAGIEVMLDFARLGENSAARTAAKRLARRDAKGFGALAMDPDFPDFAHGLAIRDWQSTDPARAESARDALHPADPGRALIGRYRPDPTALLALAETDPALRMLDLHLVVLCPEPGGRAERLAGALEMLGGWWGLADLGPPAEALIDPDRWARSVQGLASFVRLLPDFDPQDLSKMDRCLAHLSVLGSEERGELK